MLTSMSTDGVIIIDIVNHCGLHNQCLRLVFKWLLRPPQHEGYLPFTSPPQFVLPWLDIEEFSVPRVTVVSSDADRDRVLSVVHNTNIGSCGCRCAQNDH